VIGYVLAPLLSAAPILQRHPPAVADLAPVRARMYRGIMPISLVSIAVTAYFVVDVFALSAAVGGRSHQVGIYVAYGTVAHVPFFLLQAASVALVPALAATRSARERADAIRRTMTDTIVLLAGPTLLLTTAGDAAGRVVFGDAYRTDVSVVLPLALATGAVTILANLVAVDVAIGRLRTSLVIAGIGAGLVAIACTIAARHDHVHAAGDVAWAALAASAAAMVALAVQVRVRHGALLELRRSASGLVLAAVLAVPPAVIDTGDGVRVAVAAVCGVAWLTLVIRLRVVDVRRSAVGAAVADAEHA
jgi:O-antigen/teichoic acid export membrane protein